MKHTAHQYRVNEFMRKAGQDVPTVPCIPSELVRILRAKLMLEECLETILTGLGVNVTLYYQECPNGVPLDYNHCKFEATGKPNLILIADGCADESVVTTGTLSACGIADQPLLEEVDRSNLAKFGLGAYRRPDGKWMKPDDWTPPDIAGVLERQLPPTHEDLVDYGDST